jgi:hypothetical protein
LDDAGDVSITFCCHDVVDEALNQLGAFLSEAPAAPTASMPRPRARLAPVAVATSYQD